MTKTKTKYYTDDLKHCFDSKEECEEYERKQGTMSELLKEAYELAGRLNEIMDEYKVVTGNTLMPVYSMNSGISFNSSHTVSDAIKHYYAMRQG